MNAYPSREHWHLGFSLNKAVTVSNTREKYKRHMGIIVMKTLAFSFYPPGDLCNSRNGPVDSCTRQRPCAPGL